MPKVLGIDLGTTNSCMAIIEAGEPRVLENAEGGRTTPSMVGVNPRSNERYVGMTAKRQAITNPENTVFCVKRLMGRKFTDKTVKSDTTDQNQQTYIPPETSKKTLNKRKKIISKKQEPLTLIDESEDKNSNGTLVLDTLAEENSKKDETYCKKMFSKH